MLNVYRFLTAAVILLAAMSLAFWAGMVTEQYDAEQNRLEALRAQAVADSVAADSMMRAQALLEAELDPIVTSVPEYITVENSHLWLSDSDIYRFAQEKGLEVAAVKAVIDIETGRTHMSFWMDGKPLINFDRFVFKKMAAKNGIDLAPYEETHPLVFNPVVYSDYSQQQAAEQARHDSALDIDTISAIEGTFWGMFQIGGFNWKLCKTRSPQHFVELMSRSAYDQLMLFGAFLESTSLMQSLKAKDWEAFAYRYNGVGYANHSYHLRLEAAYNRFKKHHP